jgi:hypothetical protein
VPTLAKLKPATSSEDPRAAAVAASVWTDGWGGFGALAAAAAWPALGPLTMPDVRLG